MTRGRRKRARLLLPPVYLALHDHPGLLRPPAYGSAGRLAGLRRELTDKSLPYVLTKLRKP
jgi:hypothetical protein